MRRCRCSGSHWPKGWINQLCKWRRFQYNRKHDKRQTSSSTLCLVDATKIVALSFFSFQEIFWSWNGPRQDSKQRNTLPPTTTICLSFDPVTYHLILQNYDSCVHNGAFNVVSPKDHYQYCYDKNFVNRPKVPIYSQLAPTMLPLVLTVLAVSLATKWN